MFSTSVLFPSGTRAGLGTYDPSAGGPLPPMLPPSGFLQDTDHVFLEVAAGDADGTRYRAQQRPVSGQTASRIQLPVYPDVTYGASGVTWTGDWDLARLSLGYSSQATPPTMYVTAVELTATRGWIGETGGNRALPRFDPTMLPGWDASWAPPPSWVGWTATLSNGDLDGEHVRVQSNGGGPP